MRKTISKYFATAVITACLTLALSGTTAKASGYLVAGAGRTDASTAAVAPGGLTLSGGRVDPSTTGTASDSGNILDAIGEFFIGLFG